MSRHTKGLWRTCNSLNGGWRTCALLAVAFVLATAARAGQQTQKIYDVQRFGAVGDNLTANTEAINRAIETCANEGGGVVAFPPGKYVTGTIHLRSRVHLQLGLGATLVGTTNLSTYKEPRVPQFMPEARWGKWHRALILGQDVEDVVISGPGTIDGNRVFDPTGEERMRGPHTIVFVNCRKFVLRDLSVVDSANYAVFFQVSDEVEIRDVKFVGGWDGVHFRGAPERWCRNVKILDCEFYTGDDSIAGRYWQDTVIANCIVNSSCNGIRLIGPARNLIVDRCLFYGPGEHPHRTSGRTNMLSGIILQPGAWDQTRGPLDEVLLSNNTMANVASPVTLWIKPGNTANKITVSGLQATGVYRAGFSAESWADAPITNVVLRDCRVEFTGGGTAGQGRQEVKGPGVDARPLPAWGVYARHVENLVLEDVRLSVAKADDRPAILTRGVNKLTTDQVRLPGSEAGESIRKE